MKTKWMTLAVLAGLLLTGNSLFAESHFSFGIGIGTPGYYAPPPVVIYRPPYPGPGYYWMDGYYDPYGAWIPGYWAPPRVGFYGYAGPRYYGGPRYYAAPRFYGAYDHGFRGRGWARGHRR